MQVMDWMGQPLMQRTAESIAVGWARNDGGLDYGAGNGKK